MYSAEGTAYHRLSFARAANVGCGCGCSVGDTGLATASLHKPAVAPLSRVRRAHRGNARAAASRGGG